MHISIDASPSQLRKLKKGLPVRVKKGTGFNLIVHPHTYNRVSRAFAKNKGLEIALSQEELKNNEEYEEGDEEGDDIGGSMIPSPSAPSKMGDTQQPQSRGTEGQGIFSKAKRSVKDAVHRSKLADSLNEHLQSNYDYMGRAGIDNAIQMAKQANMSKMGINARKSLSKVIDGYGVEPRSRMYIKGGSLTERSTTGLNGGMMHVFVPPALISQPFSANFQMQHFLPPQYQHYEQGGNDDSEAHGLGSGLYAGRGLGLGIMEYNVRGGNIKNDLRKYARAHGDEAIDYAQGKIMRRVNGGNIKNDLRNYARAHGDEAIDYAQGKIMRRIGGRNIKNDARNYARAHGDEAIDYAQGKIMRRIGGRNIKNDARRFGRAHGNEAIDYAQGKIMKRI